MDIAEVYVSSKIINRVFAEKRITLESPIHRDINSYLILKDEQNFSVSAVVRLINEYEVKLVSKSDELTFNKISPKDVYQLAFLDSVANPDILLSVATGKPGSGKTTLACAYALDRFFKSKKRIILSKPTAFVGGKSNAFAAMPGDLMDKYAPYLASFEAVLGEQTGGSKFLDSMMERKDLEFAPIEFLRGRTFKDCTFILDEAQALPWHELKTLVSRAGEGCKLILLGDLGQIDTKLRKA